MPLQNKTKKMTALAVLLSLAVLMGYLEMLIPFDFGIPGIKLGLANYILLLILYLFSAKDALLVSVLRVLLVGTLFSNYSMVLYSLGGVTFSLPTMWLLKKTKIFSPVGVSIGGGIMHNVGQFAVAYFVLRNIGLFGYFPFLLLAGALAGGLIGILVQITLPRVRRQW